MCLTILSFQGTSWGAVEILIVSDMEHLLQVIRKFDHGHSKNRSRNSS